MLKWSRWRWIVRLTTLIVAYIAIQDVYLIQSIERSQDQFDAHHNHNKDSFYSDFPTTSQVQNVIHINSNSSSNSNPAAQSSDFIKEDKGLVTKIELEIEQNENAAIAADIVKITQVKKESKIIVQLKKMRKCGSPQLIGRLSGPVLTTVKWKNNEKDDGTMSNSDEGNDLLVGYYHVPVSGQYFIEIIVTTCTELDMDVDAKPICIQDPDYNRLTHENATITAVSTLETDSGNVKVHKNLDSALGFWYNKNEKHRPMYTRYQRQNCRNDETKWTDRCKQLANLSRFDPYEFKFTTGFSSQEFLNGKKERICFEGDSHSRVMWNYATKICEHSNVTVVRFADVERPNKSSTFHYAGELNSEGRMKDILGKNCTKVVFATGQWDAGFPKEHPTSFREYEDMLESAIHLIAQRLRDEGNVDVYFRKTQ